MIVAFSSAIYADVPVLVYHRFGPQVLDSMTVRTSVFLSHLQYLRDNGYQVIPMQQMLDWRQGKGTVPDKSVVITIDDGHKTVYTEVLPIIKKYKLPVTLFIYPSAISNAPYALTWSQLNEILATGLVTVQSHTYWHPNFKIEKKRLSQDEYVKFVDIQFNRSRTILEKKLNITLNLLAWPFGIYNSELMQFAEKDHYFAAFALDDKPVTEKSPMYALPRYLMIDAIQIKQFAAMLRHVEKGNR